MKKNQLLSLVLFALLFAACDLFDQENQHDGETDIAIVDLPSSITTYIAANFVDFKIEKAEADTLCSGMTGIEVEIEHGKVELTLFFDSENNFLLQEEEIDFSDVPIVVQTLVSITYADFDEPEDVEKVVLADGTIQYNIEIELDNVEKDVIVNADGTEIICEE